MLEEYYVNHKEAAIPSCDQASELDLNSEDSPNDQWNKGLGFLVELLPSMPEHLRSDTPDSNKFLQA